MTTKPRLLLVGNSSIAHLGARFLQAAQQMELPVTLCDTAPVFDAPWMIRQINWRLRDHRPPRLISFSQQVVEVCQSFRPDALLANGLAPLNAPALREIKRMGIARLNFLTDDPWNPAHRSRWFFEALPLYDIVFSPRHANLDDLRQCGCRPHYLPFGYDPALHFPEPPPEDKRARFECDVLFYGGADRDRLPFIKALINHGVKLHLYGGFWNRYAALRPYYKGHADPHTLRWAVAGAKVTLCLVRQANRDGHVMRTFEVPAMGGCMLAEDTADHRAIFGEDGSAVVYFRTVEEMLGGLDQLLADAQLTQRLASAARQQIVSENNTYFHRLERMIGFFAQSACLG